MNNFFSLKNKVAVITGSSRGIGKGIAVRFAELGAKIIISCRKIDDGACWAVITRRVGQFVYGFYPEAERWRIDITFLTMFVAFVFKHDGDPFSKKEKSLLYLILFIFLMITGPGKFSLDNKL